MGWIGTLLGVVAVLLLWETGHTALIALGILSAVGAFWSWGIMHNFATEAAKQRSNYTGGFYDITAREAKSVPDWITNLNLIFTLSSLALLITAIIIRVF